MSANREVHVHLLDGVPREEPDGDPAGPCALESRAHALETSHALVELTRKLGIGLIYKSSFDKANRTSLGSARGLGLETSLPILAEVRETWGCPVLTDIHLPEQCGPVAEAGKSLVEKLEALEDQLIQKRTVDGQTVINFEVQLNHHFIMLHGAVDGSEEVVIQGERDLFRDLMSLWNDRNTALDALLGADLDAFNAMVREKGIPSVILP